MYKICKYPEPILRKKLKRIEFFKPEHHQIAARMIETMHGAQGIGIAANQVGLDISMAIITDNGRPNSELAIVNPEIVEMDGHDEMVEGCLSFPSVRGLIVRKEWIKIKYQGLDGNIKELEADGMLGKCIQHEIDHLNGMSIYMRMNQVDKFANKRLIKHLQALYDAG
jgi:peptide deformylase